MMDLPNWKLDQTLRAMYLLSVFKIVHSKSHGHFILMHSHYPVGVLCPGENTHEDLCILQDHPKIKIKNVRMYPQLLTQTWNK